MEASLASTPVVAAETEAKTQRATIALASRSHALPEVVMETTLGMMVANVPSGWIGEALAARVNMKAMRVLAAALIVALGVLTLRAGIGSA